MQSLVDAYAKDKKIDGEEADNLLSHFEFSEMKMEETPALYEAVQVMTQTLLKISYAICKYSRRQRVDDLMLTGIGATLKNLSTVLCAGLNKRLMAPVNPNWKASCEEMQTYAVSIGLALTALPSAQEQINFRQQELAYPHPWKRYRKPAAIYAGLCCLAGLSIFLFGQAWIGFQEDQLKEKYGQVLTVINKSYQTVESEYANKNPDQRQEGLLPLKNFTQGDLRNRLQFIEKQLQATPDIYPLQPNVPRVSDVLAWLSTHANLAAKVPESNSWQPLMQIESFNYTLVKRPELSKKQEKYQVKIDLEFSSPTPKLAREFHDALIAPNDLVDPKGISSGVLAAENTAPHFF